MTRPILQKVEKKPAPQIYGFKVTNPKDDRDGYIKVGYTTRSAEIRAKEIMHTGGDSWEIVFNESSVRPDGTYFKDHPVHQYLKGKGITQYREGEDKNEWYRCTVADIQEAVNYVRDGIVTEENRTETFKMRPEQEEAVKRTMEYFAHMKESEPDMAPKFLWNAKMRFGKTFVSYELAKRMEFKRVLVLTFKPAVESAWRSDLMTHVDFEGWQFISNNDARKQNMNIDRMYARALKDRPIVVFGSFQDLLGTNTNGGIKAKNEFIHSEHWDLVIFDEYHYGAWRENARNLFEPEDEEESYNFDMEEYKINEADNAFNESFLPITADYYLYLSGTPFRAINNGEFIEDQIYSWTYTDEQSAKENWEGPGENPYASLPRMIMLTYQLPDEITKIASQGEFDEFDLNVFFKATGRGTDAKFVYEDEVQKWLDLIRGGYIPQITTELKQGKENRPPMPFSDARLLSNLNHTVWFLPNVASCQAMYNLLKQRQNVFYHDYKINLCAGTAAGIGEDALRPVIQSMRDPLVSKTITLTCGKLTTGVTIKPWTGIFMLRNLKSPETYFQAAFRVQSPWEVSNEYNNKEIIKQDCYVFDFALNRALRQISDYSCRLSTDTSKNSNDKIAEFTKFLPVLAYDGSSMKEIDADEILDMAMSGTSATLLARRWESALLVNVDNDTLRRLMSNKEAMDALMRIESFRNLNSDIETIINKSEHVKKAKKSGTPMSAKEREQLSDEKNELKSKRKEIQAKLIKFATRIPIFMYLTDYRERTLKDVITQLEPELFKKVTGLDVKDFDLLCSLGVFNSDLMNDAIFKFKRYEDTSLSYTGIETKILSEVGGWDVTMRREEYKNLYYDQQETMNMVAVGAMRPRSTSSSSSSTTETSFEGNLNNEVVQQSDEEIMEIPEMALGDTVYHKKFGEGTIAKLYDGYIVVKFEAGEKTFKFPDAFLKKFISINEV